jgi:ribonuclease HII
MIRKNSMITVGIDEVGIGALAGPIYVAAVVFRSETTILGLTDSKKLSHSRRCSLLKPIGDAALDFAIVSSSAYQVDRYGVANCKRDCFKAAALWCVRNLPMDLYTVIVDGIDPIPGIANQECLIKADLKIQAVSAASILAKVTRDLYMMRVLHKKYPEYKFDAHKGYGTVVHTDALNRYGPCPQHRRSYAPIKRLL